jgi:hypothetical protein
LVLKLRKWDTHPPDLDTNAILASAVLLLVFGTYFLPIRISPAFYSGGGFSTSYHTDPGRSKDDHRYASLDVLRPTSPSLEPNLTFAVWEDLALPHWPERWIEP